MAVRDQVDPVTEASRSVWGGNERGGFEIQVEAAVRIVHVRLWGIWTPETAADYCAIVVKLGTAFMRQPWGIVADSRQFGAQSPEVTEIRQDAMAKVRRLGCAKIASIGSNAVHAMQFQRIAHQSHVGSGVFADVQAARAWILGDSRPK